MATIEDAEAEAGETFTVSLSVSGTTAPVTATDTIENMGRMPKAWLARFGRTVAEQVVENVQARLDAPRTAGAEATLGGQALPSRGSGTNPGQVADADGSAAAGLGEEAAARLEAKRTAQWLAGEGDGDARAEGQGLTDREVLVQTAFSVTVAPEDGGASAAIWGRGASSSFRGRDGPLSVNGEVSSATLGADWRSGSWLPGTMFKHSLGEGSYSGDGGSGKVESALTGIYPYAALDVNKRLRAWGTAGLGEGTLTLTQTMGGQSKGGRTRCSGATRSRTSRPTTTGSGAAGSRRGSATGSRPSATDSP